MLRDIWKWFFVALALIFSFELARADEVVNYAHDTSGIWAPMPNPVIPTHRGDLHNSLIVLRYL